MYATPGSGQSFVPHNGAGNMNRNIPSIPLTMPMITGTSIPVMSATMAGLIEDLLAFGGQPKLPMEHLV